MHVGDLRTLFAFNDWANNLIIGAARGVPADDLARTPTFTYRSLRGTLVHTLDVEWSWRILLKREHPELWDTSLSEDDFRTIDVIEQRWAAEQSAMSEWLSSMSDHEATRIADIGNSDRYPVWYYLVHIVTHSEQQRRDAQLLLRSFGVEPPDLEFLYYADAAANKT
jgi:uncharacterized damage-inducible protein DinB